MRPKTSLAFVAVLAAVAGAPAPAAGSDAGPRQIVAAAVLPSCDAPLASSIACWPRPCASPPRRSASAPSRSRSARYRRACPAD